jgi:transcriptional regulator with GAF, ATPase, and Fis domain
MEPKDAPGLLKTYEYELTHPANNSGLRQNIRILFYGETSVRKKDSIRKALQNHGLKPSKGGEKESSIFGLVFFDTVDNQLSEAKTELFGTAPTLILGVSTESIPNTEKAWNLLNSGFSDIIAWREEEKIARDITARLKRWEKVEQLLESKLIVNNLIGTGDTWKKILRHVIEVSHFSDASVLILGQSGTGKELLARLVHSLDPRRPKLDLVIVDCSTIVPELSGSEFFGHKQGAFTGAFNSRVGAFQIADGGTLFLDEIGELPPQLQPQLLRVVQEGAYKRVGSNKWRKTDFRLICATNRDLKKEVEQGRFRADLYYRLADWVFYLPPLNERPEDIIPLARHFLEELDKRFVSIEIDEPVRQFLISRAYPGNVRELRQLVRRIGQRHVGGGSISIGDIPEDERPKNRRKYNNWRNAQFQKAIYRFLAMGLDLKSINKITKDAAISIAVNEENGNLQKAARKLGVTDRTLQMHRASNRG